MFPVSVHTSQMGYNDHQLDDVGRNKGASPVFCERGTAAPDSVSLTIVRGVFHLSIEPCHAGDLFPPAQTIHTHRKLVSASLGDEFKCMNSVLGYEKAEQLSGDPEGKTCQSASVADPTHNATCF